MKFKLSLDKTATTSSTHFNSKTQTIKLHRRKAVQSNIGWTLSGPLPSDQEATATTATFIAEDKANSQLNKRRDIKSYESNCDVIII